MIDLTPILSAVVALISALVSAFLIPYIKARADAEKLSKAITVVEIAVLAAEQIYNASGMGELKKAYVKQYLAERGFAYDDEEINAMIESAVYKMKEALI